ncbi:hypothetical protein FACS1894139_01260 [Planctomycetales bacterium]|nr:hypothetical protein FACS1894107_03990 [Planctomycetales bacterium]GHT02658.1 hypothetical protein FACS1894139_01260 [Planctomycetales bacterium]
MDENASKGFAPENLWSHYRKHGVEFLDADATAYNRRAQELLRQECVGDIAGFTTADGWRFRYEKRRNELVIGRPDGFIATYFKPVGGIAYWEKQVSKYGKR